MATITGQTMLWNIELPELTTILVEHFQLPPQQLESSKSWDVIEFSKAIETDLEIVISKTELLRALAKDIYIELHEQNIAETEATGQQKPFALCLTDPDTAIRKRVEQYLRSKLNSDSHKIIDFWGLPIEGLIALKNIKQTLIFAGLDCGRAFGAAMYFRITYGLKCYTLKKDALCATNP
jgi:hypothetical protein